MVINNTLDNLDDEPTARQRVVASNDNEPDFNVKTAFENQF